MNAPPDSAPSATSDDALLPVTIDRMVLDSRTQSPIVLLRGRRRDATSEEDVLLPIWIGPFEAFAIAVAVSGEKPPRPLTHDLFASVIHELGAEVEKVVVRRVKEGTFYGELHLDCAGETIVVDARPSDCMALAVRTGAPIFAAAGALEAAVRAIDFLRDEDREKYRAFLESLEPGDFSRYKM